MRRIGSTLPNAPARVAATAGGGAIAWVTGSRAGEELRPGVLVLLVALVAEWQVTQALGDVVVGGDAVAQVLGYVAGVDHVVGVELGQRRQIADIAEVLLGDVVVEQ